MNIIDEYSREIEEIRYILNNLENGRIYERTGAKQDGYLSTNVQNLKQKIVDLLIKIQNGDQGDRKRIKELFNKYTI